MSFIFSSSIEAPVSEAKTITNIQIILSFVNYRRSDKASNIIFLIYSTVFKWSLIDSALKLIKSTAQ